MGESTHIPRLPPLHSAASQLHSAALSSSKRPGDDRTPCLGTSCSPCLAWTAPSPSGTYLLPSKTQLKGHLIYGAFPVSLRQALPSDPCVFPEFPADTSITALVTVGYNNLLYVQTLTEP